ncbi:MAG: AmmeMemoRadiSam system protein A [Myxococcales bacterium]|nr:AmmeMemoRadiSam system protein A [Myxococcales bacterium]
MPDPLVTIAREALSAAVRGEPYAPTALDAPLDRSRGVFVTLEKAGELRGCIGHLAPTLPTLAEEVATVAVLAGTRDSRFPPVSPEELGSLQTSISLLSVPEPTTEDALDARRYGVIVTSGHRRGVLLPDLEGVDTPADQIRICRRKAGIPPHAPVTLERFTVEKRT